MVRELAPLADGIITTQIEYERAIPAEDLAARIAAATDVPLLVSDNPGYALDMARAEAGSDGAVLVTGSLYLVGEARDVLEQ